MTEKQYNRHIKKVVEFCAKRNEDTIQATDKTRIEFLTEYYDAGVGYSSVNSERSALSSIIKPVNNVFLAGAALVCRFMEGVFNLRPALPRYVTNWTVSEVLIILRANQLYHAVTLKQYHIE